ncbi:cation:proton antiporter [Nocardioides sp. NPDC004968]|uniref:cation:proton antiporter n=1 Tax=Nocardioides sp. NPDC004968 TaxID=3155894 RepID=UPI0033AC3F43
MPSVAESLLWISIVAVVAPIVAGLIPRRLVPEVVLLLGLGMLIGPFGLTLAVEGPPIELLSELGLGMLFLLAGFEIKPAELIGRAGRRAGLTWLTCLGLAFALTALLAAAGVVDGEVALAIALTSTALGTLLPILKDSGMTTGRVGESVLRHGAYGELGPVVAMALLLGTRGATTSLLILLVFAAVALLLTIPSLRLRGGNSWLLVHIRHGAESTSQTPVRLTLLLLVTLSFVAHELDLDIVLAAFAAGFILRLALPDGDERFEARLEGIAFGLLVPVFFVTSGMAIDPRAIGRNPGAFAAVLALILIARALPVFIASRFLGPPQDRFDTRVGAAVALFAATGLPIIVAVTSVSVSSGEMSTESASVLVGAGATTVLLLPMLATVLLGRSQPRNESRSGADTPTGS